MAWKEIFHFTDATGKLKPSNGADLCFPPAITYFSIIVLGVHKCLFIVLSTLENNLPLPQNIFVSLAEKGAAAAAAAGRPYVSWAVPLQKKGISFTVSLMQTEYIKL